MVSHSVCNQTSDWQNRITAKRESDFLMTSMTTDWIGRHEVMLSINHNCYNFRKNKQIHLSLTFPVETVCKVKNSSILEIPQNCGCCHSYCDQFYYCGFNWEDLVWLAALTVRLQVSDYSQLSDYKRTEWFLKNKATNAQSHFRKL